MKKEKKLTSHIADVIAKQKEVTKEEIYVDGAHEYDYAKDDTDVDLTIHTLYYSDSAEWSDRVKSKIALELVDNGNGVLIKQWKLEEEIDYLQLQQLYILLKLTDDGSVYEISKPAIRTIF
jgi:hypothetical protein